jgi:hypothetical protein
LGGLGLLWKTFQWATRTYAAQWALAGHECRPSSTTAPIQSTNISPAHVSSSNCHADAPAPAPAPVHAPSCCRRRRATMHGHGGKATYMTSIDYWKPPHTPHIETLGIRISGRDTAHKVRLPLRRLADRLSGKGCLVSCIQSWGPGYYRGCLRLAGS